MKVSVELQPYQQQRELRSWASKYYGHYCLVLKGVEKVACHFTRILIGKYWECYWDTVVA